MRKLVAALALAVMGSSALSGCYLSRQIAGDDLVGGPVNPGLWATVPLDTLLLPLELPHFINIKDNWTPWSAKATKAEYVDLFALDQ